MSQNKKGSKNQQKLIIEQRKIDISSAQQANIPKPPLSRANSSIPNNRQARLQRRNNSASYGGQSKKKPNFFVRLFCCGGKNKNKRQAAASAAMDISQDLHYFYNQIRSQNPVKLPPLIQNQKAPQLPSSFEQIKQQSKIQQKNIQEQEIEISNPKQLPKLNQQDPKIGAQIKKLEPGHSRVLSGQQFQVIQDQLPQLNSSAFRNNQSEINATKGVLKQLDSQKIGVMHNNQSRQKFQSQPCSPSPRGLDSSIRVISPNIKQNGESDRPASCQLVDTHESQNHRAVNMSRNKGDVFLDKSTFSFRPNSNLNFNTPNQISNQCNNNKNPSEFIHLDTNHGVQQSLIAPTNHPLNQTASFYRQQQQQQKIQGQISGGLSSERNKAGRKESLQSVPNQQTPNKKEQIPMHESQKVNKLDKLAPNNEFYKNAQHYHTRSYHSNSSIKSFGNNNNNNNQKSDAQGRTTQRQATNRAPLLTPIDIQKNTADYHPSKFNSKIGKALKIEPKSRKQSIIYPSAYQLGSSNSAIIDSQEKQITPKSSNTNEFQNTTVRMSIPQERVQQSLINAPSNQQKNKGKFGVKALVNNNNFENEIESGRKMIDALHEKEEQIKKSSSRRSKQAQTIFRTEISKDEQNSLIILDETMFKSLGPQQQEQQLQQQSVSSLRNQRIDEIAVYIENSQGKIIEQSSENPTTTTSPDLRHNMKFKINRNYDNGQDDSKEEIKFYANNLLESSNSISPNIQNSMRQQYQTPSKIQSNIDIHNHHRHNNENNFITEISQEQIKYQTPKIQNTLNYQNNHMINGNFSVKDSIDSSRQTVSNFGVKRGEYAQLFDPGVTCVSLMNTRRGGENENRSSNGNDYQNNSSIVGSNFESTKNNRSSEGRVFQNALMLDTGAVAMPSDRSLDTYSGSGRSYDRIPTPINVRGNSTPFRSFGLMNQRENNPDREYTATQLLRNIINGNDIKKFNVMNENTDLSNDKTRRELQSIKKKLSKKNRKLIQLEKEYIQSREENLKMQLMINQVLALKMKQFPIEAVAQ